MERYRTVPMLQRRGARHPYACARIPRKHPAQLAAFGSAQRPRTAACYRTSVSAGAMEAGVLRTSQVVTGADERQLCARFARPSWGRALWQLASTLASFALLAEDHGITLKPPSPAAPTTICRGSSIGSPAILVITISTIWRCGFRIIGCVRRSNRARCCSVHRV